MQSKKKIKIVLLLFMLASLLSGCSIDGEMLKSIVKDSVEGAKEATNRNVDGNLSNKLGDLRYLGAKKPDSQVLGEQDGLFYFEKLSDEDKQIYGQIYEALVNRTEPKMLSFDNEKVENIHQYVLNDHPEIFYTQGFCFKSLQFMEKTVSSSLEANYEMTPEEQQRNQKLIDEYVETFLSGMPEGLDDYGKIKYTYDYIVLHTQYEKDSENNQNICSVFIGGKSVCQGYTKAMQYLLRRLGIEATLVVGSADGEAHSWNLVKADGQYYYVDATWGYTQYKEQLGDNQTVTTADITYDFFMITTEELLLTHQLDYPALLPECTATEDNYYMRENLYFTIPDVERAGQLVVSYMASGQKTVTLKCSSAEVMNQLKAELFDQQKIFDYTGDKKSISFGQEEKLHVLTIFLG